MKASLRSSFDAVLEEVLGELPGQIRALLEEVPLLVEDSPSPEVLEMLGVLDPRLLCGLYTGIPMTRRSVLHSGTLPDRICVFREGVRAAAAGAGGRVVRGRLKRHIRTTVLHEIGHHFGLEEADLRELGY